MPHAPRRRAVSPRPANEEIPRRRIASWRVAAATIVVLGLAACGGPPSSPATPIAPAATAAGSAVAVAATAAASPTASIPTAFAGIGSPVARAAGEIGPVVWARAIDPATKAPTDRAAAFAADAKAIYAVVPVIRLAPNARLTASWSYNDTSLDAFTQTVTAGRPAGARWVEFHLTRPASMPWPDGDYTIVLRLDNDVVQTASITVAKAS
ncbi:MAG TPA: hypothetical protein VFQ80_05680 [Thermomicrobiales bacterium]|nr:hypothetical protein [Thermomicrobiales bacterium]